MGAAEVGGLEEALVRTALTTNTPLGPATIVALKIIASTSARTRRREKKAGKPPASAVAALITLEMIKQQVGWKDQPVLVAVAKEQLALV
jgi:hypothetical protein